MKKIKYLGINLPKDTKDLYINTIKQGRNYRGYKIYRYKKGAKEENSS